MLFRSVNNVATITPKKATDDASEAILVWLKATDGSGQQNFFTVRMRPAVVVPTPTAAMTATATAAPTATTPPGPTPTATIAPPFVQPTGRASGIDSSKWYYLRCEAGGFLNVPQNAIGTPLKLEDSMHTNHQQFRFNYQSNGEYTIQSNANLNPLATRYVSKSNSSNLVVLNSSSSADISRWYIIESDSTYTIVNKADTTRVLGTNAMNDTVIYLETDPTYRNWKIAQVDAYSNRGGLNRSDSRSLTIQRVDDGMWLSHINAAVSSWNDAIPWMNISTTTNESPHKIQFQASLADRDGQCILYPIGENGFATASMIEINIRNAGEWEAPYEQAVIAHEMGHLFWLEDNPSTLSRSLMKYDDVHHHNIYTPQQFDVKNVRFLGD